jgi:hypothetical protein
MICSQTVCSRRVLLDLRYCFQRAREGFFDTEGRPEGKMICLPGVGRFTCRGWTDWDE